MIEIEIQETTKLVQRGLRASKKEMKNANENVKKKSQKLAERQERNVIYFEEVDQDG